MTERERLPNRRAHETFRMEHGGLAFTAGIGRYPDGRIAELFVNADKIGTGFDTALRDSAILLSFALQHGADIEAIRRAVMRNVDGLAAGPIGAVLDFIARGAR